MNAVVMMFLGGGVGLGLLLLAQALRPSSRPIFDVFDAVAAEGQGFAATSAPAKQSVRDVFVSLGSSLAIATNDEKQLRKDLAVTDSTLEQHGLVKAATPALTLLAAYLVWVVFAAVGVALNPFIATFAALALSLIAFILPEIKLRARAKERRIAFRHALSAYLDLVTIILSGGGGLQTALQAAADAGDGWAFAEIRAALDRARLSNRTAWSQLGDLGERFDIPELRDLAATAELAGSEGSRITESVTTKADVLRSRLRSDVEQTSEALTEQMLLPVGLLLIALFLFLGFAVFQQLGANSRPQINGSSLAMVSYLFARAG